ncbi:MAG TPA: GNAT family N-acetyltransferase [Acidobacteriota bacterium]|jgi:ribosomal-protein-alanine N-acetyltransferase
MSIQVRHFQDPDFPELLRIDQACFEPGIAYDEPALDYFVRRVFSHTLVLVDDSQILGFGVAAVTRSRGRLPAGHIITLDLLPEARGKGYGRILLQQLESLLEQDGAVTVILEVDVRNTQAIGFYRKMGYRQERILRNYYGEKRDALRMSRQRKAGC